MKKVIFLGFNKTAGTSLSHLFRESGYNTIQNDFGKIARDIKEGFEHKRDPFINYKDCDVITDMMESTTELYIEGNEYYKYLHSWYPDSYFVLNIRKESDWINSRLLHQYNKRKFVDENLQSLNIPDVSQLKEFWKTLYKNRHSEIISYFKNKENFIIFDIDNDHVDKIINFVNLDFNLEKEHYKKLNVTSERKD